MALTKNDLKQIENIVDKSQDDKFENVWLTRIDKMMDDKLERKLNKKFDEFFLRLIPIFNKFVTKDEFYPLVKKVDKIEEDVNELKDDVIRLEKKFDIGFNLLKHQVDQNTEDIKLIKGKLNLQI